MEKMALCFCLLLQAFLATTVNGFSVTVDDVCGVTSSPYQYTTMSPGKQLKEECTKTSECSQNRGPTVCSNGQCKCAPNYSPSTSIVYSYSSMYSNYTSSVQTSCQMSPGNNQLCTDECRWPYKCIEMNTTTSTTTGRPYMTTFPYPSTTSAGPRKYCQCVDPFKYVNYDCMLQCKDDEVPGNDACYKRCSENEVQLLNFECKPIVGLGEPCEVDQQCSVAFSSCSNKKCECRGGFKQNDKSCVAVAARCEYGDPYRTTTNDPAYCILRSYASPGYMNSAVVQMGVTGRPPSANEPNKDICPEQHYCQAVDSPRGDKSIGICCPYPRPYCPVGEAHPTANCSGSSTSSMPRPPIPGYRPEINPDECPPDTHYCFYRQSSYNNFGISASPTSICCPRACPLQSVSVDNRCLPLAPLGGKCQANEQCSDVFADCVNGVCVCPSKSREQKQASGTKVCVASCDYMTEIQDSNRCYPRLAVGDRCRGLENRCPYNSFCNSSGICQCSCGTASLNGALCAYRPYCPLVSRRTSTTPYVYQYTQSRIKAEDFEKLVLCRYDPSRPAPTGVTGVVDSCPENQFCNSYMGSLGVCCEKPEPYCPYNDKVYDKCENTYTPGPITQSQPCKPGQFCYQFYYGGPNVTGTAVCCDPYTPTTRTYYPYQSTMNQSATSRPMTTWNPPRTTSN